LEETILARACANDDGRTVDVRKLANYCEARITLEFPRPERVREDDGLRPNGRGDLTCGTDSRR
jgi:hypothetical protein